MNYVLLKIDIPNIAAVEDTQLTVTEDSLSFSYKDWSLNFKFRLPVNDKTLKYKLNRTLELIIEKKTANDYWPHILSKTDKKLLKVQCKVDWDRFLDEDDAEKKENGTLGDDEDAKAMPGMGGMGGGGMPGMGGMGGGMGGMGGGGGGMDFSKMMAGMGGGGGMGGMGGGMGGMPGMGGMGGMGGGGPPGGAGGMDLSAMMKDPKMQEMMKKMQEEKEAKGGDEAEAGDDAEEKLVFTPAEKKAAAEEEEDFEALEQVD